MHTSRFFHLLCIASTAVFVVYAAFIQFPSEALAQANSTSQNQTVHDKVLRETIRLLYKKEYKKALQHIDDAFSSDSGSTLFKSRAFVLRAAALKGLGASAQAVTSYNNALLFSGDSAHSSLELDEYQILQSAQQAAIRGKYTMVTSDFYTVQQNSADTTKRNIVDMNLLQETAQILEKEPNDAVILYQRGYLLLKQQRYDSASLDFQRAAALLPPLESASAYFFAGQCYFFMERHSEAIQAFTQTLNLVPFHGEGFFYRGCANIKQARFTAAIKDFRSALQHNPDDAASMGLLGSLLINSGQKVEGCARLLKASELGYFPAVDLMNHYCNKTDDYGQNIVQLPTVTVEADKNVNYVQRIKNTKQGISVGQRVNPINPTLRNIGKNFSFAGTTTLSDGTTLITSGNPLANLKGMLPLQSMMNPVDCNSGIINTKSYLSLQCIANFLRQETETLGNKAIDKIVKQLQQLADELTITQAAIDNLSGSARTNVLQASADKHFGGDMAQIQSIYRDFQSLLGQLQKKMEEYEKVLKAEGKIP
jgi:tetratricopeptide (TPR) repeat protein